MPSVDDLSAKSQATGTGCVLGALAGGVVLPIVWIGLEAFYGLGQFVVTALSGSIVLGVLGYAIGFVYSSLRSRASGGKDRPPRSSRLEAAEQLNMRMKKPQRHRLLQGYPAPALMIPWDVKDPLSIPLRLDPLRPLIVGILPHPFCNPRVKGCGFCTFPHEQFSANAAQEVCQGVRKEITSLLEREPSFRNRRVDAVYFGGGTANLTPLNSFKLLGDTLCESFDLRSAEISLEGVPSLFLHQNGALVRYLKDWPVRHVRISMGVQSFDQQRLSQMGREAFGGPVEFRRAVELAHDLGMTASCDLLYNLPGQNLEQMLADVDAAISCGYDQVCLYHLVMFKGLSTVWAQDPELLSSLPELDAACDNWTRLRTHVIEAGYVQTTLTNFERAQINRSHRRFTYEECSFQPETYDAVGFGPSGISCFSNTHQQAGLKFINAAGARDYLERINAGSTARTLCFKLDSSDMKLLHLTRQLSRMRIRRDTYRYIFGITPDREFVHEFAAFEDAGLVQIQAEDIVLTPKGMFYADSIAGLLANERIQQLRKMARGKEAERPSDWEAEPSSDPNLHLSMG